MSILRIKKLVVALLLMAFMGQAIASAVVPCYSSKGMSDSMVHEQVMNTGMMDHSQDASLQSLVDPIDDVSMSDCGTSECDCSLSNCFTALIYGPQRDTAPPQPDLVSRATSLTQDHLSVSLYRPPISR